MQITSLLEAIDFAEKVFNNPENYALNEIYVAMITVAIGSKIKTDIDNARYSFWMSCTAP